jgi:signal recognition particle subunit SRP14
MFLDTDKFLRELGKLYERNKASGTVYITMKRTNQKPEPKKGATAPGTSDDYVCLVRATNGKTKISAAVGAKDHMRFLATYNTLMKAHMDSLKKKDKKRTKAKDKA